MRTHLYFAFILTLILPVFPAPALESPRSESKETELLGPLLKREAYLMRATNILQRHRAALLRSDSRAGPTEERPGYFTASLAMAVANLWQAAFPEDAPTETVSGRVGSGSFLINPAKELARSKPRGPQAWNAWTRSAAAPVSAQSDSVSQIDQVLRRIELERAVIGALMNGLHYEANPRDSRIALARTARSIHGRLQALANQATISDREHRDRQMIDFEFQLLLARYNQYAGAAGLPAINPQLHVRTAGAAGSATRQL